MTSGNALHEMFPLKPLFVGKGVNDHMKRKLTCIGISLVMCLFMVFPAIASTLGQLTQYMPEWQAAVTRLLEIESATASLRPAGFNYRFIVYCHAGNPANSVVVSFLADRPVMESGTRFYLLGVYTQSLEWSLFGVTENNPFVISNFHTMRNVNPPLVVKYANTLAVYEIYVSYQFVDATFSFDSIIISHSTAELSSGIKTILDTVNFNNLKNGHLPYTIAGNPPPSLDDTKLRALLVEADKIEDIGYTPPTWTRFETARHDGHELMAQPIYTQPQVNSAYIELDGSMQGLAFTSVMPPYVPPTEGYAPPTGGAFDPGGKDLGTGEIMGYLLPGLNIYMGYVISITPVFIALLAVLIGIWILPKLFDLLLRIVRR